MEGKITMASLNERLITAEAEITRLSTLLSAQKGTVASPRPQQRTKLSREQKLDRDVQRALSLIEETIGVDEILGKVPEDLGPFQYEREGRIYTFLHRVKAIEGLSELIIQKVKGVSARSKPALIMATAATLRSPKGRALLPVKDDGDDTSLVIPISG